MKDINNKIIVNQIEELLSKFNDENPHDVMLSLVKMTVYAQTDSVLNYPNLSEEETILDLQKYRRALETAVESGLALALAKSNVKNMEYTCEINPLLPKESKLNN